MAKGQTPLESLLQDLRQAEIETDGLFDDSRRSGAGAASTKPDRLEC